MRNLGQQLRQRRKVEVAFEQRGAHAQPRIGLAQERPDHAFHRRPVGIDLEAVVFIEVARYVQRGDTVGRHASQEFEGVVTVVAGIDEDVVDVQQEVAVGFGEHGVDEVDLAHVRAGNGVGRKCSPRRCVGPACPAPGRYGRRHGERPRR